MIINLEINRKTEAIQSILYCSILFGDSECMLKLLHPKGTYLGMTKARFIYFVRTELTKKFSEFISEDAHIFTNLVDLGKHAGTRCFIFNRKRLYGRKPPAYVFLPHPDQNHQIWKIIKTVNYVNEKALHNTTTMFKKGTAKKYNALYKN